MARGIKQSLYVPEMDPEEEYGTAALARRIEQSIRDNPDLRSSFDYSQLEEKYPVTSITGRVQLEEKRRKENPYLEEEIAYRKSIIEDRATQLELKKSARELDIYEAKINREDAMLEQIPLVRQKLAELDARDPNLINKVYDIQDEHPMAFESKDFQTYILKPMLDRNARLIGRQTRGFITQSEAKQAMDEILKYEELRDLEYPGEDHPPKLKQYLGILQNRIDQFSSQRGMPTYMGSSFPRSELAPSADILSFGTMQEAEEAERNGLLQSGDKVSIGGRTYIFE